MSVSYPSFTLPDPTPFGLKLNSSLSLSYENLFPDPDPPQIPEGEGGRERERGSKGMAVQSDLFVSAWGRQEGPQWGSPYLLFLGRGGIPSLRIFDRLASPAVSNITGG